MKNGGLGAHLPCMSSEVLGVTLDDSHVAAVIAVVQDNIITLNVDGSALKDGF
jgi:hypothetical protein